ncbi:MAG: iron ABC transporter permease [Hyphomicrobiales bacterium]|nr:MAG: iron ABC transporter permease [Hyphomicrobiales bacterium]
MVEWRAPHRDPSRCQRRRIRRRAAGHAALRLGGARECRRSAWRQRGHRPRSGQRPRLLSGHSQPRLPAIRPGAPMSAPAPARPSAPAPAPGREFVRTSAIARRRLWIGRMPWIALMLAVIGLVALPTVPLQIQAFSDGAAGFKELAELRNLGETLTNTVVLGVGALVVAMVLGVTLALCMTSLTARSRSYLFFLPVLTMVIPSVAHVVGFVFLLSPENGYINTALRALPFLDGTDTGPLNIYTREGIVLYTGIHLSAFVYLFVFNGLRDQGRTYALAARVSGASAARTLFTVTLPLLRPVLVYAGTVCLLLALGQFTAPLMLGRRQGVDVLMTQMFEMTYEYPIDYGLIAALGTPLMVLAIVVVAVQRRIIGNQDRFVGRREVADNGSPSQAVRIGSTTFILLFTLLAAGLPLIALIFVALSPFWSGSLAMDQLSMDAFHSVMNNATFTASITTSVVVSVAAVLIVIPFGMVISLGIYNRHRLWGPVAPVLDFIANMPLGVPAALLGFGYLFIFTAPGFAIYGTMASFILAYLTLMIPYSVRYQLATLISLGRDTMDASRVSGAGPLRTLGAVILPLARGGIASSAAIMFVLLIHEFGISLLLRSPKVTVMSVVLFQQYDGGTYPQTAVMALIMTAITAVGLLVALGLGGSRSLEKF